MALGPHLRDMPEESWKIFKEEKRQNMVSFSSPNCPIPQSLIEYL